MTFKKLRILGEVIPYKFNVNVVHPVYIHTHIYIYTYIGQSSMIRWKMLWKYQKLPTILFQLFRLEAR